MKLLEGPMGSFPVNSDNLLTYNGEGENNIGLVEKIIWEYDSKEERDKALEELEKQVKKLK